MQKHFAAFLTAGVVLAVSVPVLAQAPNASTNIGVGHQTFDLSQSIIASGDFFTLPSTSLALGGGSTITVAFQGDQDPSLTYSFSATNPTPFAQNFSFDAIIPIIPTVVGSHLASSLTGSLTDGADNGVTVTPIIGMTHLQAGTGVDINGDDHNLGLDLGQAVTGSGDPGGSYNYPTVSASGTSTYTIYALDVHLRFTLSGNGDAASFNGRVAVTGQSLQSVVPEPGSIALLVAAGVTLSGCLLRRRR